MRRTDDTPDTSRRRDRGALLSSANLAMADTLALVTNVAATDTTVTITGETGTGKEVLARHLHAASPRRGRPFIAVNCGALSASIIESELFGHERGAFSGAHERRVGYFEAAHGGTLLLDEISELPLDQQTRLLRVLQEGEVQRVGGNRAIAVDVRVVATTNRDLAAMVEARTFRQDLYYRLNVFPIQVPALRHRREDLPALARVLLAGVGGDPDTLTAEAIEALAGHSWPGNVRELRNALERARIIAGGGPIRARHVVLDGGPRPLPSLPRDLAPTHAQAPSASLLAPGERLEDLERRAILGVLADCDGNRTVASDRLGISVRTLRNRLRDYRGAGIPVPAPAQHATSA